MGGLRTHRQKHEGLALVGVILMVVALVVGFASLYLGREIMFFTLVSLAALNATLSFVHYARSRQ